LEQVLSEVVVILSSYDQQEKAAWLESRLRVLQATESDSSKRIKATSEVHGVIVGMGGLLDSRLTLSTGEWAGVAAHERLERLADRLYVLTTPPAARTPGGRLSLLRKPRLIRVHPDRHSCRDS
jgi:hypothetical protein